MLFRSPHLPGQLIGGSGGADAAGVDLHCMAVDDADAGTQMLQNLQGQRHIGDLGDIFDPADPVHQQSGGNDDNGSGSGALWISESGIQCGRSHGCPFIQNSQSSSG